MPTIKARFKKVGGTWMLELPPRDMKDQKPRRGKELPIIVPTAELVGFGAYPDLPLSMVDEAEDDIDGTD